MSYISLRNVLIADAITCAAVAVIGIFDAHLVAPLLGLPQMVIKVAGWICLPTALLLAALAVRPWIAGLKLIIAGNLAWVAASLGVVVIYAAQLTGIGIAIVAVQALAVLGFVYFEKRGLNEVAAA